jgi:hypothetical protein
VFVPYLFMRVKRHCCEALRGRFRVAADWGWGLPKMSWRTILVVLVATLTGVLAATGAEEPHWIPLQDGIKARLLTAAESTDPSKPRELGASFVLSDPKIVADHAKVIDVADQLFGRVVLAPADTKGFKRAAVNILISETKAGDTTDQEFEDFHYARGGNAVWLREAGKESWKTAQDPAAWTPPQSETVQLPQGTVYVDFAGEVFAPAGATKALGIEMRSNTPATNIPGKYAEIKALWERLDHAKLKDNGFDFVGIENYGEARRGRFHVRQRLWVELRRQDDGSWPVLPETAPLKGSKGPLVAGLGTGVDDDATRFASAAVGSIVFVSRTKAEPEGVTTGIGISARAAPSGRTPFEYLKPGK